jgi:hypothetical protein
VRLLAGSRNFPHRLRVLSHCSAFADPRAACRSPRALLSCGGRDRSARRWAFLWGAPPPSLRADQSGWAGIAKFRAKEHGSNRCSPNSAQRLPRSSSGNGCSSFLAGRCWSNPGRIVPRAPLPAAIAIRRAPSKLLLPLLPTRRSCTGRKRGPSPSISAASSEVLVAFLWSFLVLLKLHSGCMCILTCCENSGFDDAD